MPSYRPLMAKRVGKDGRGADWSATLYGHSRQCLDIADWLADGQAEDLLAMSGVVDREYVEWFRVALRMAAAVHDAGKATDAFQRMLRGGRAPHLIRHEMVSLWMVTELEGLREAVMTSLGAQNVSDWRMVLFSSAIVGHHLKFPRKLPRDERGPSFNRDEITVLLESLKADRLFTLVETVSGTTVVTPEWDTALEKGFSWEDWEEAIREPLRDALLRFEDSPTHRRLGSLLRGALVAVDTLGSGLCENINDWNETLVRLRARVEDKDLPAVLGELVAAQRGGSMNTEVAEITEFQERVAAQTSDIVVVDAGCGSGKTVAAYRWAQARGAQSMFFTFPTTATATQSFDDYSTPLGERVQLMHSRSEIDIELLPPSGEDVHEQSPDEDLAVSDVISHLQYPATTCTVDTLLRILTNYRPSVCLLPRLCTACLVFDEVHAYDDVLFEHFIAFLEEFHLPTLVMTASLPPSRRTRIEEIQGRSVAFVDGPEKHEARLRYRLADTTHLTDLPVDVVLGHAAQGGKVLVVANTVRRAIEWFIKLSTMNVDEDLSVLLLHSRYKYMDRVMRQRHLSETFRSKSGKVIAVTTQICELSFDISAGLLVSDMAPLPSLVQRMGRLNRTAADGDPCREVVLIEPPRPAPYCSREMALAERGMADLAEHHGSGFSQQVLRELLETFSETPEADSHVPFAWRMLYTAKVGDSIRRHGYTVDVIMETDYAAFDASGERKKRTLPLPQRRFTRAQLSKRWRHCIVVPDDSVVYDGGSLGTGGRWADDDERSDL